MQPMDKARIVGTYMSVGEAHHREFVYSCIFARRLLSKLVDIGSPIIFAADSDVTYYLWYM